MDFQISVKTKALSLVQLDPAHQALIDRILKLHQEGLNSRQIADYLNELGITSWGGKRFYPELVFGVIWKARHRKLAQESSNLSLSLGSYPDGNDKANCKS